MQFGFVARRLHIHHAGDIDVGRQGRWGRV